MNVNYIHNPQSLLNVLIWEMLQLVFTTPTLFVWMILVLVVALLLMVMVMVMVNFHDPFLVTRYY